MMSIEDVEDALTNAIQQWMAWTGTPADGHWHYSWGNAQGIARALAALRSTTFSDEWQAGLDRYQNRIVVGSDRL